MLRELGKAVLEERPGAQNVMPDATDDALRRVVNVSARLTDRSIFIPQAIVQIPRKKAQPSVESAGLDDRVTRQ